MARWIWIYFFPLLNCYNIIDLHAKSLFLFSIQKKSRKRLIFSCCLFCALLTEFCFWREKNWENINKKEDNKFWRQILVFLFFCFDLWISRWYKRVVSKKRSQSCANYQPRKLTKAVTPIFLRFVFSCRCHSGSPVSSSFWLILGDGIGLVLAQLRQWIWISACCFFVLKIG